MNDRLSAGAPRAPALWGSVLCCQFSLLTHGRHGYEGVTKGADGRHTHIHGRESVGFRGCHFSHVLHDSNAPILSIYRLLYSALPPLAVQPGPDRSCR